MTSVTVTEQSQVAEARRHAVSAAAALGFSETEAGRVAIVATELATNLVKHGAGGELVIGPFDDPTGSGLQLLALDKGTGFRSLQEALRDGYSTAGSAGQGLGAIARQSQGFEIASWPDLGAAAVARLLPGPATRAAARPDWAGLSVPKRGESVCGDAWAVFRSGDITTAFVADGLGHGPDAAEAARTGIRLFAARSSAPIETILKFVHDGLRPTRGAAVAVARIDPGVRRLTFAGIGNIAGVLFDADGASKKLVSHNGTAGHAARRIQAFEHPFPPGSMLVMHSDGLTTSWSLDRYPGLRVAHPALVSGVLYRDFSRGRDDVTVLTVTGTPR